MKTPNPWNTIKTKTYYTVNKTKRDRERWWREEEKKKGKKNEKNKKERREEENGEIWNRKSTVKNYIVLLK